MPGERSPESTWSPNCGLLACTIAGEVSAMDSSTRQRGRTSASLLFGSVCRRGASFFCARLRSAFRASSDAEARTGPPGSPEVAMRNSSGPGHRTPLAPHHRTSPISTRCPSQPSSRRGRWLVILDILQLDQCHKLVINVFAIGRSMARWILTRHTSMVSTGSGGAGPPPDLHLHEAQVQHGRRRRQRLWL